MNQTDILNNIPTSPENIPLKNIPQVIEEVQVRANEKLKNDSGQPTMDASYFADTENVRHDLGEFMKVCRMRNMGFNAQNIMCILIIAKNGDMIMGVTYLQTYARVVYRWR